MRALRVFGAPWGVPVLMRPNFAGYHPPKTLSLRPIGHQIHFLTLYTTFWELWKEGKEGEFART